MVGTSYYAADVLWLSDSTLRQPPRPAGGSRAPKSAALALLRAWKMLAIEMGKNGKNKHEGSPSCWKKRPFFCTVSLRMCGLVRPS